MSTRLATSVAGLVVLGTVPFAALAWTAVVPVLLAVLAGLLALPLVRSPRRAPRPSLSEA